MTGSKLLVITPVHNEERHLPAMIEGVREQTRTIDAWLLVDDGSTDSTPALLRAAASSTPYVRIVTLPATDGSGAAERLYRASEIRAFNAALRTVERGSYDFVGKLDGDLVLPPDYYHALMERFERLPRLGMAGGGLLERRRGIWRGVRVPSYHVPGGVKVYRSECLEGVGGLREHLGWDTIDETYARMEGWTTASFPEVQVRHLRTRGTTGGTLRGHARYGACAHAACYPPSWIALRSLRVASRPPWLLSGLAFGLGYARARLRDEARVQDPAYRRFVRGELRDRMRKPLRELAGAVRGVPAA